MCQLDTCKRDSGSPEGFQSEHGSATPFYRPVILFDHVVEIAVGANFDRPPAPILLAQQPQCQMGGRMPIDIHLVWPSRLRPPYGALEERLRSLPVPPRT